MRILIINTSERIGGAAIAANRLMVALNKNGIQTKMLVRDKQTHNPTVLPLRSSWRHSWNFLWERLVIWFRNGFSRKNLFAVDIANTGTDITKLPEFRQADIIHLHWINQGMLSLKNIKKILESGKPIVWTMHDMWPFTGICHHAGTCLKYRDNCQSCPQLTIPSKADLSKRIFKRKRKIYSIQPITFVACSNWLAELARTGILTSGHHVLNIPNPIDTKLFKPTGKSEAREALHLPADKRLLLFGSVKISDPRKGIDYLLQACNILQSQHPDLAKSIGIIIVGGNSEAYSHVFPFPVYNMQYVAHEKDLATIYNASDIYVTPSLQENLPNTIVEAMSCGVPCVGFQIGGIPEMIDHLHNGYVASYQSAEDLAEGIRWSLMDGDYETLSHEARRKAVSTYSEDVVARKYIQVYNQITGENE